MLLSYCSRNRGCKRYDARPFTVLVISLVECGKKRTETKQGIRNSNSR